MGGGLSAYGGGQLGQYSGSLGQPGGTLGQPGRLAAIGIDPMMNPGSTGQGARDQYGRQFSQRNAAGFYGAGNGVPGVPGGIPTDAPPPGEGPNPMPWAGGSPSSDPIAQPEGGGPFPGRGPGGVYPEVPQPAPWARGGTGGPPPALGQPGGPFPGRGPGGVYPGGPPTLTDAPPPGGQPTPLPWPGGFGNPGSDVSGGNLQDALSRMWGQGGYGQNLRMF